VVLFDLASGTQIVRFDADAPVTAAAVREDAPEVFVADAAGGVHLLRIVRPRGYGGARRVSVRTSLSLSLSLSWSDSVAAVVYPSGVHCVRGIGRRARTQERFEIVRLASGAGGGCWCIGIRCWWWRRGSSGARQWTDDRRSGWQRPKSVGHRNTGVMLADVKDCFYLVCYGTDSFELSVELGE
jgi:hypothetical protein